MLMQRTRQRTLPCQNGLPAPHRLLDTWAQKGSSREIPDDDLRSVHPPMDWDLWGSGNGNYRGELKRALEAITWYVLAHSLPLAQMLIRLDGLYGNAAPLMQVLNTGMGVIARA